MEKKKTQQCNANRNKGLVAFQRIWSVVGEAALWLCRTLGKRQRRQANANAAAVLREVEIKIYTLHTRLDRQWHANHP